MSSGANHVSLLFTASIRNALQMMLESPDQPTFGEAAQLQLPASVASTSSSTLEFQFETTATKPAHADRGAPRAATWYVGALYVPQPVRVRTPRTNHSTGIYVIPHGRSIDSGQQGKFLGHHRHVWLDPAGVADLRGRHGHGRHDQRDRAVVAVPRSRVNCVEQSAKSYCRVSRSQLDELRERHELGGARHPELDENQSPRASADWEYSVGIVIWDAATWENVRDPRRDDCALGLRVWVELFERRRRPVAVMSALRTA